MICTRLLRGVSAFMVPGWANFSKLPCLAATNNALIAHYGKNITRILDFLYTEVRLKSRPGSKPECFTTETREELLNFSTSCFCFGPQQLLVTVQAQMVFIYVIWPRCSRWQDFLCFHWKLRVYPTLKITVKYNLEKGTRLLFFFFFARTQWTE